MNRIVNFLKNHVEDIILIGVVVVAFYAGVWAQSLSTDLWKELLMEPEPEICRACEGTPHAPILVNLSTGQTGEFKIYDSTHANPYEIDRTQNGDACTFTFAAGTTMTRDQANQKATARLPEDWEFIQAKYFCRSCRALLTSIAIEGFVLLDKYDPDDIKAYEIKAGKTYEIRDYTVEIYGDDETDRLIIDVTGHVFDRKN